MAEVPHAHARVVVLGMGLHGDDLRPALGGGAEGGAAGEAQPDDEYVALGGLGDVALGDGLGGRAPARGGGAGSGTRRCGAGCGRARALRRGAAGEADGGETGRAEAGPLQEVAAREALGVFHVIPSLGVRRSRCRWFGRLLCFSSSGNRRSPPILEIR